MMKINKAPNLFFFTATLLLLVHISLASSSSSMAPTSDGQNDGVVYRVGDRWGWTGVGGSKYRLRGWTPINYQTWADSKAPFHVGDILHFVFPLDDSVVQVSTLQDYITCNIASPLAQYTSGNEFITLNDEADEYYFISGYLDHCRRAGQKFHLKVLPRTRTSISSSTPIPLSTDPIIMPPLSSPTDLKAAAPSPIASFGHSDASKVTSNSSTVFGLSWTAWLIFAFFAAVLVIYACLGYKWNHYSINSTK